jgi:hypothetical protein
MCAARHNSSLSRRQLLVSGGAAAMVVAGSELIGRSAWSRKSTDAPTWDVLRSRVRSSPIQVPVHGDFAAFVPHAELCSLLLALTPCWNAFKTSLVTHALRLWGSDARFRVEIFPRNFASPVYDGSELRRLLADSEYFCQKFPAEPPLMVRTPYGVRHRYTSAGFGNHIGVLGHVDEVLCVFAETSMAADAPLILMDGASQVRDLVVASAAHLDLRQELPWTVEGLARYLAPLSQWTNRFGQICSFDDIAATILALPLGEGPCLGTHDLYCLVILLGIDKQYRILSSSSRAAVEARMGRVAALLESSQSKAGLWLDNWHEGKPSSFDAKNDDDLMGAVTATGHHLEWIAIAPSTYRPTDRYIASAIHAVLKMIEDWSVFRNESYYAPLSHLARALCMLGGNTPMQLFALASKRTSCNSIA